MMKAAPMSKATTTIMAVIRTIPETTTVVITRELLKTLAQPKLIQVTCTGTMVRSIRNNLLVAFRRKKNSTTRKERESIETTLNPSLVQKMITINQEEMPQMSLTTQKNLMTQLRS